MIIRHNIAGINSNRNKTISETKMKKNLEKLSTGYRINRAGDDAAGLAISELMRSQIGGIDQALKNCNDGISMTNTGEGALTEVHAMLQRMKTLAVQSANATYTSEARANLDAERSSCWRSWTGSEEIRTSMGFRCLRPENQPDGLILSLRPWQKMRKRNILRFRSGIRRRRRLM